MPTKKKRLGFIPREDVMKIINSLSLENNLSNSKIISILVEEALSNRGIFNKKNNKESPVYHLDKESLGLNSIDSFDFNVNDEFIKNSRSGNHQNPFEKDLFTQINKETFDLHTYKQFLSFLKFKKMIDEYNT